MKVNGKDISMYRARVQDFVAGPSSINSNYFLGSKSMHPVFLSAEKGLRELMVTIEFQGDDWKDTDINISNFTAAVADVQADLYMEDGFYYFVILEAVSEPEVVLPEKQYVTFTFAALRHEEMKQARFASSGALKVAGNLPADCIVSITPNVNMGSVSIMGVTLKNLSAGLVVVIDGISKMVLEGARNKFGDTDLVEFPKLQPGINEITVPGDVTIEIKYYPLYL